MSDAALSKKHQIARLQIISGNRNQQWTVGHIARIVRKKQTHFLKEHLNKARAVKPISSKILPMYREDREIFC